VALKKGLLFAGSAALVAVLAAAWPTRPATPAPAPVAHLAAWRVQQKFHTANAGLADIVATSRTNAWAAGVSSHGKPVVYRWNGTSWRAIARPGRAGSAAAGVAASSARNVWVAISGEAAVDHWNGHAWKRVSFGSPDRVEIDGLTTTGPRDVWVFSYDSKTKTQTAFGWNGRRWKRTRLPGSLGGGPAARLASASSPSNVWAWAYDAKHRRWESLHYNGHAWKRIRLPRWLLPARRTVLPEQLLAKSAHDVWGTVYAVRGATRGPVVLLHWDGHHWSRMSGHLPGGTMTGPIATDGNGGLWLGAQRPGGAAYLAHYLGGRWTRSALPASGTAVTALALIPGTQTLWASGVIGQGFGTSRGAVILRYGT
jgi:hypothetical protein